LRSRVQGELLAALYLAPERSYSLSDLARRFGVSVPAIHAEANRLSTAGWILEERLGNNRMLLADPSAIIAKPLTELLALTYGPLPLLSADLHGIEGVESAFIYGSWAARYRGVAGPIPNDIDLLIVGQADPDLIAEAVEATANRLQREINVRRVTPSRWASPGDDPFITTVQSRPFVEIPVDAPR